MSYLVFMKSSLSFSFTGRRAINGRPVKEKERIDGLCLFYEILLHILFHVYLLFFCITNEISFTIISLSSSDKFFLVLFFYLLSGILIFLFLMATGNICLFYRRFIINSTNYFFFHFWIDLWDLGFLNSSAFKRDYFLMVQDLLCLKL